MKNAPLVSHEDTIFGPNDAEKRYLRFADEAASHLIGPMPVDKFLDEFLPKPTADKPMPDSKGAFDGVPEKPQNEGQIYAPLVRLFYFERRCC